MTTTAITTRNTTWRTDGKATNGRQAGILQAIRAEWTKLITLRSTKWTLAIAFVGAPLVAFLSTHSSLHHPPGWYGGFDPTNQALAGLAVAPLTLGVLGVLAMSGEYGTGTIRSSLAAMPRRDTLFAAKIIVIGLFTLIIGEVLAFATFFLGQAVLSGGGAPYATLGQPGVLRAVALSGAYVALFGLLGLGLGAIIRHTGGGIASYAGVTLLPPLLLAPLAGHPARFAPANMFANSVAAVVPQHNAVGTTFGFTLMCAYTLFALVLGVVILVRRDA